VPLNIRGFVADDTDAVVQLWKDCGLVVPWNNPEKDIQRKLTDGAELFLVGERDGCLMATLMGGYEGHRGWANYLAVAPQFQGRGDARKMMEALEARLLKLGCPKLNLQVRETNVDVLAFYKALGYKRDAAVSLGKRLIPDC